MVLIYYAQPTFANECVNAQSLSKYYLDIQREQNIQSDKSWEKKGHDGDKAEAESKE